MRDETIWMERSSDKELGPLMARKTSQGRAEWKYDMHDENGRYADTGWRCWRSRQDGNLNNSSNFDCTPVFPGQ